MLKKIVFILLCLSTLVALGQSTKYQVGTVVQVKPHTADNATDPVSYEVSLKIKDSVYVVLYAPAVPSATVKYVAGRDVLVSVGDKTIKYNDLLGQTIELPIINREAAPVAKKSN